MSQPLSLRVRAMALGVATSAVTAGAGWFFGSVLGMDPGTSLGLACLTGALVGLALGWALLAGVCANLSELGEAIGQIARGSLNTPLPTPCVAELSTLEGSIASLVSQLKLSMGNYQGFTDAVLVPYALVDTAGNLIKCNQRALEMLERSGRPDDHKGMYFSEFFYGDRSRRALIVDIMEKNQGVVRDVEFKNFKGNTRFIQAALSPLHDLDGKVSGGLCMYLDFTEIRAKEAEITAQGERIMSAVRMVEEITRSLSGTGEAMAAQVETANRGAELQSRRTEETAASMEQMNATVLEVARNAGTAAQRAGEAQAKAQEGQQVVGKAVEAIRKVDATTAGLKQSMDGLSERAQAIGKIMNVISDIADQTNLLALNAAIEAARAGDAGRGFAVVADEVRKLAEKTMAATKEVGDVTAAIQTDVRQSIQGTDQAARAVEDATALAGKSGEALDAIVDLVAATSDQVRAIATAAEEQSAASEEIARAVEDVRRVSQETAQEMTVASKGVEAISRLTSQLGDTVRSLGQ